MGRTRGPKTAHPLVWLRLNFDPRAGARAASSAFPLANFLSYNTLKIVLCWARGWFSALQLRARAQNARVAAARVCGSAMLYFVTCPRDCRSLMYATVFFTRAQPVTVVHNAACVKA